MPQVVSSQRTIIRRFLKALGDMKDLPDGNGQHHACFGCYRNQNRVCRVQRNVDPVCALCFRINHQSSNWTQDALGKLAKK